MKRSFRRTVVWACLETPLDMTDSTQLVATFPASVNCPRMVFSQARFDQADSRSEQWTCRVPVCCVAGRAVDNEKIPFTECWRGWRGGSDGC